ncbi:hypothetical protein [Marinagarivorans cellulosilyticus]|uniref:hypothetical protein n=1 Tax=Marinagarivorans cellulosilyticus TaxID=2721545 RepID=UPI001F20F00F|nr:hypothetical protein [Marinagarivorans cellulosilyticus]
MPKKLSQKIAVRTDLQLKMRLEDIADARGVSVGELVREILKRSVRTRRATVTSQVDFQSSYISL